MVLLYTLFNSLIIILQDFSNKQNKNAIFIFHRKMSNIFTKNFQK